MCNLIGDSGRGSGTRLRCGSGRTLTDAMRWGGRRRGWIGERACMVRARETSQLSCGTTGKGRLSGGPRSVGLSCADDVRPVQVARRRHKFRRVADGDGRTRSRVAPAARGLSPTPASGVGARAGRTHVAVDVLVVFASTVGVSLVEFVSPAAEVQVPRTPPRRRCWVTRSDGELIADVIRRLQL